MSKRWLPHSINPRWSADSYDLKKQLGLPKKLVPRPEKPVFIACIADNTGEQIEIWDLPTRGFQRLHAKYGDRMIPTGRVRQTKGLST